MSHITVLLHEALDALNIRPDGHYLDMTFGRGGHSRLILEHLNENGRLYAIDRDPEAVAEALKIQDPRFYFQKSAFSGLNQAFPELKALDGVLMDLGVSSPQLDDAQRGFSFSKAGAIDMRMDNQSGLSAYEWLKQTNIKELSQIIRDWGGEPHTVAQRIAQAIIQALPNLENNTIKLAKIIADAVPKKFHRPAYHPATQTFQAIRMAVNQEIPELESALNQAVKLLKPNAYVAVISFHSGEDQIVKRFFRRLEGENLPAEIPLSESKIGAVLEMDKKVIRPNEQAIIENPRCRSAILRRAKKLKFEYPK